MSKLFAVKFVFLGLLLWPALAEGADLRFGEQTWTVEPHTGQVSGFAVRNDHALEDLVRNLYGPGNPYSASGAKLEEAAAKALADASLAINQPTKPAKLVVKDNRAEEFEPGQNGQVLDVYKTYRMLEGGRTEIELPVILSRPANSLADTNSLGIRELVATGESDFAGSPYNRRVNIQVGAGRYQGLIIAPGEEFSFNKFLGEVDAAHGFLPELVIKRTGLTPEFGGGLCQVSSTAFRAAMKAGLPITERRNHSFAVQYYAPQGTDATIYPGVTDFRFVNDLSSHLLIRTRIEGSKLYFDFYGTPDDRRVTFDGPYQYDKQANGAMKAVWTRWVEKGGENREQIFRSVYQPPALFTQTAQSSTPNPQAEDQPQDNPDQENQEPQPEEQQEDDDSQESENGEENNQA